MPITGSPGLHQFRQGHDLRRRRPPQPQFAAYLLGELQLKKDDRVAIMLPNCLQYPVAIFGVLRGPDRGQRQPDVHRARTAPPAGGFGREAILVLDNFGDTVQECWITCPGARAITSGLGDMLGFPQGSIVNFVLKHVKMVPTIASRARCASAMR